MEHRFFARVRSRSRQAGVRATGFFCGRTAISFDTELELVMQVVPRQGLGAGLEEAYSNSHIPNRQGERRSRLSHALAMNSCSDLHRTPDRSEEATTTSVLLSEPSQEIAGSPTCIRLE